MKKITGLFAIIVFAVIVFVSCEPVENRISQSNGRRDVTMADIDQYVKIDQLMIDGKGSNYFSFNSESLQALSSFQHGLGTLVGSLNPNTPGQDTIAPFIPNGYIQCFVVPGVQTILFTALNADGTTLTKTFTFTVDSAYHVAPEWAIFCGDGSKDWIWDTSVGAPYGMGDALNSNSADWWGHWNDDGIHNGLEGADASMTFTATGSTFTKNLSDGTTVVGTFGFDMTKVSPPGYARSVGTLTTSIPVLNGQTTGAATGNGASGNDVLVYQMIKLDDNHLYLCWPEASFDPSAGWGQATLWFFKPAQ